MPLPRIPALLPLLGLVAGCGDSTPMSWIPFGGSVSGTVVVAADVNASTGAPPIANLGPSPFDLRANAPAELLAERAVPAAPDLTSARSARPEFAAHDLIVTFRPDAAIATSGANSATAAAVMRTRLASVLPAGAAVSGVSPAILSARVLVADTTRRAEIAAALRQDPAIAAVSRNRLIWLDDVQYVRAGTRREAQAAAPILPNNPLYPLQAWHYGLVDMPRAWGLTTGSNTVLVAVVDDGMRFDHPSIAANLTSDGYDFVSDADSFPVCTGGQLANSGDGGGYDSDPTIPSSYELTQSSCFAKADLGAHGLHVAGTIGAVGNNAIGVTGINWTVRIRPVRALGIGGFGSEYDIAQGILYAAGLPADNGLGGTVQASSGARIINLSLGGGTDDATLHSAVVSATNTGALIVAAAGNSGTSGPSYPAAYPEVLAVAAVGPNGAPVSYSNFGAYVAIRAPGGDFNQGGATGGVGSTMWSFARQQPAYAYASGTSMASPHVAGVAALLLARTPSLTAADLRDRLTKWAVGPPSNYGVGLLNAYNSLTQSMGPPRHLFVRLVSAGTGEATDPVAANDNGGFSLDHVRDGAYYVFGGADEDGDGKVGIPGRLWGAIGGAAVPTSVTIVDHRPPVAFTIGFPTVVTTDHFLEAQNVVVVGGYVRAVYGSTNQLDVYRLKIPESGTYTFETSGWVGACGYALEEATGIGVYDLTGKPMITKTFNNSAAYDYCTRLTTTLTRGSYLLAVAGGFSNGRYRLQARAGS